MSESLALRLRRTVAGTPLEAPFETRAADFLERLDAAVGARVPEPLLPGVARSIASNGEAARFWSHRRSLHERLTGLDAGYLERRDGELRRAPILEDSAELESFLDELRLLRREETALAACLDLGGIVAFPAVSRFLSTLAEAILRRALHMAQVHTRTPESHLAVVSFGKLGSGEFTYYSDLDLVFLFNGPPEDLDRESRVVQRLVTFLSTMTGAGVAYSVDARLRPSGHQGSLVTSLRAFEEYQVDRAQTWEHLALTRARTVAGDVDPCDAVLSRIRQTLDGKPQHPWETIGDLRGRIALERAAAAPELAIKTGPGGLMDVEFLAAGALLELGGTPPSRAVPDALQHGARGPIVDEVLSSYHLLRRVEARARWVAGSPVESLPSDPDAQAIVAEVVEPGCAAPTLRARVGEARETVRAAMERVLEAGTIGALAKTQPGLR